MTIPISCEELQCLVDFLEEDRTYPHLTLLCADIAKLLHERYSIRHIQSLLNALKINTKTKQIKFTLPEIPKYPKKQFDRILTPSGKCPIALKNADFDTVIQWISDVLQYGLDSHRIFTPEAVKYYAKSFDFSTEQSTLIQDFIDIIMEEA